MHFEFSDVEDDDQMAFKLRDRSPSDPLISLEETIDLRRYVRSKVLLSKSGIGGMMGREPFNGYISSVDVSVFVKKFFCYC